MAAEHNYLIFLIGAGNFSDDVESLGAFRKALVLDIEFERHLEPVREQTRNAAIVLITQDHCRHNLINIEGPVVERSDLAMFAPGIVNPDQYAIFAEKLVGLLCQLRWCQHSGFWCRRWA